MAIEYGLVLAGGTPVEQVAARAFPVLDERPVGTAPLLVAALNETYGFVVTVRSGASRYVEVVSDEGSWEWEPSPFTSVSFRFDKWADDIGWQVRNMLTVVRRVLDTGDEDAAFSFNGDILLLRRLNGVTTKHRRAEWWEHYDGADQVIPG
ncbi:hypothetical protein JIG36_48960 [Actinoplanes sp. LDG1-06]|uniref:Uncharacterized protein n=1 Tax=Paractinoplanes ovalisporus TaxID=2810368 RepID=A0ABS2AU98_9ACTN|nr:SitI3 family protein [Actinoplanes ovalisporus]MBM2623452.1 hypothetical protein [Actinoplanes ovalisporus]